jgi:uncharacterized protein YdiU (UPF0061 family)
MLPLFDADLDRAAERAKDALGRFAERFEHHWLDGMRAKLGLLTREDEDRTLVIDLLGWMQRRRADFTNTFRSLTRGRLLTDWADDADLRAWHERLEGRRARQPHTAEETLSLMQRHNPAFIPRNHKVEEALAAATSTLDLSVMQRLLDVLGSPYDHDRELPAFSEPATSERPYRTFCGT